LVVNKTFLDGGIAFLYASKPAKIQQTNAYYMRNNKILHMLMYSKQAGKFYILMPLF